MQETHDLPVQDPRGSRAGDPRGDRAAAGQGGVSGRNAACPPPRIRPVGGERSASRRRVRRLAGFVRTLRDNGFKVGLAETRDALAILPRRRRRGRSSLKPALRALFCADPFRLGALRRDLRRLSGAARGMRRRASCQRRAPARAAAPACGVSASRPRAGTLGLPDHVERARTPTATTRGDGRGRREGASRAESLATTDMRHIVDPDEIAAGARARRAAGADACGRGWCAASRCARRGRRLDLRRTIHRNVSHGGTPVELAWRRRKIEAAAARRAARRFRLDEPLHRVLRALPAWRRRRLPRGGGLRLPHAAGACVAVAARPRRHARGRPAGADGAGHRRRHAHRREPRHVQSLARAPRDQFAHRGDDRLRRLRHRRARAARATRCGACGAAAGASSGSTR